MALQRWNAVSTHPLEYHDHRVKCRCISYAFILLRCYRACGFVLVSYKNNYYVCLLWDTRA